MLHSVLNYLADPVYFGVFSLTVGSAYVIVWIVSLKEVGKTYRTTILKAMDGEEMKPGPVNGNGRSFIRSGGRRTVTLRRVENSQTRSQARVSRSA